jgi:hypothetical protein
LSTRKIANQLQAMGHIIGYRKGGQILHDLGYTLQSNKKVLEGKQHQDRNKQFLFINALINESLKNNQPVISVDTKKKELVGNYKNNGVIWRPAKDPIKVNTYDFPDPTIPKAIPYGIYDIGTDSGFVSIGIDHDTATFAVASILGWWNHVGKKYYSDLKYLVVTADGGGSNGYRIKLWKYELQKLANILQVPIKVCHFPPGTSKWNKIEHRLFSFISTNWKGQPLRDYETIVNLISHTYTEKGLSVVCKLDRRKYKLGIKVTDQQMKSICIERNSFHEEWNYIIYNQKL